MTRVSVGLMTMNNGRFLKEAIESVRSQDSEGWEMVIADDCSTDNTGNIVGPYLSDQRITYIRHSRRLGQANNWNFCLNWGKSPIVCVLHADDAYLPGALKLAIEYLEANDDVDLFFGNALRFRQITDSSGRVFIRERVAWGHADRKICGIEACALLIRHNHALPSCSFLRRSVLARSGPPDADLHTIVDTEFFQRVAIASRFTAFTHRTLCRYREHEGSLSASRAGRIAMIEEDRRFPSTLQRNLLRNGLWSQRLADRLAPEVKRNQRLFARARVSHSVVAATKGNWSEASHILREALHLNLGLLWNPKVLLDVILIIFRQTRLLRCAHWRRTRGIVGDEVVREVVSD